MHSVPSVPGVVVVSAHPDDEAIFTGLLIRRIADLGGRVVLVTATGGELGAPSCDPCSASTVAAVRQRELERSCELLGVARLVLLGLRDSGLPGSAGNRHPQSLLRSRCAPLAARVARIAVDEGAQAIVYDDADGIYGHPDHVGVHRIGAAAARRADVSGYEVTVDGGHLAGSAHLVARAAASAGRRRFGAPSERIGMSVRAGSHELVAKWSAMAAHTSQIDAAELARPGFDRLYGREWLTRTRGAAVLEALTATPPPTVPAQHVASRLSLTG